MNNGILTQPYTPIQTPYGLLGSVIPVSTPENYIHPEAADWKKRVISNSSTVSDRTLKAVSKFCYKIDAANMRDRFYRLNLFCGNDLSSCIVPLYRAQSIGTTQLGGTTDTNFNFVSTDYVETGSSGGLTGTGNNGVGAGSSKHLRTGLNQSVLATSNLHLASFVFDLNTTAATQQGFLGIRNNTAPANRWWIEYRQTTTSVEVGGSSVGFGTITTPIGRNLIIGSRSSSTLLRQYTNNSLHKQDILTDITSSLANRASAFYIFGLNIDGTAGAFCLFRMGFYSIGLTLNHTQVTALYDAIISFNIDMNRS